jgi:hypothetical protein
VDGIQTRIHRHFDGEGGISFERVQDCTAIAERCKARQNMGDTGSSEMKLAASLPLVMVERYMNDHAITFNEFMGDKAHIKAMLNDPALSHFRIWNGKI